MKVPWSRRVVEVEGPPPPTHTHKHTHTLIHFVTYVMFGPAAPRFHKGLNCRRQMASVISETPHISRQSCKSYAVAVIFKAWESFLSILCHLYFSFSQLFLCLSLYHVHFSSKLYTQWALQTHTRAHRSSEFMKKWSLNTFCIKAMQMYP